MSRKRKDSNPGMPASSAGLIRFFQDEAYGVKVRPEIVIAGAVTLIMTVILARMFIP
ncbi:MAG: preprotein translocase subunit Sec61beta [Candidatus Bathyarchaeota archaeon]|nr:MAG: preprotein translocase subunit Sec61beta [Candidatus Bathyarchaeota archaeon]